MGLFLEENTMFEIGRICYKTAGRDSNNACVIVEVIDEKYVLVDGATRRKKVNTIHLEPTQKVIKLAKGAKTEDVVKALEKEGFAVAKKGAARKTPARVKKAKAKKVVEAKKA